jgi:crossover junction endodeoxyribonuclease RusA
MKIDLPWPPQETHPNCRKHWAVKMRAVRNYRRNCHVATMVQLQSKSHAVPAGDLQLTLTFHPKTNRKRDIDNLIAQMKAGLDGVADALKIDDSRFRKVAGTIGEQLSPGKVEVEIESF